MLLLPGAQMNLPRLCLKKGEERRILMGHPWIYSNEVNTTASPLKNFSAGEEVLVQASDKRLIGIAYINPHSLICARIFSYNTEDRLNATFFTQRLKQALALRNTLLTKPYYRLVFSEGDGLPGLIIDRFGNDFVMQLNTAGMESRKQLIADSMKTVFPEINSILLRNETSAREREGLPTVVEPLLGTVPEEIQLEENNTQFSTALMQGQKTGWFYDHRLNRERLTHYVKAKTVLDVFSYLGAWGITAAKHGATHVDCIDSANFAMTYLQKNAVLNGVQDKVNFIHADAFDALKQLQKDNKTYDVIVLDPPAFIKKAKDKKEGMIAYQRLNEMALRLLNPNGILVSCSCSMHLADEDLLQLIKRAAFRSHTSLQVLEYGHQGPDHPVHIQLPETHYLKAFFLRRVD